MKVQEFFAVFLLLFWENDSKFTVTKSFVQKYELNANTSKVLQRDDKRIMATWADEYQVMRLDVSVKYRLQMVKHEEHSFNSSGNAKWTDCLYIHRKEIRRSKHFYLDNELDCLRRSTSKDAVKKENVEQMEKQIAKWRKSYRYLINLCDMENPLSKENAEICLVQYMQNDKYDKVIERLMTLKQSAMNELYANYNFSLMVLEECLKTELSRYLDRVRSIMNTLNKCYKITT